MSKLKLLLPVLLLAVVVGCFKTDDHSKTSTTIPTGPGARIILTVNAVPVWDLMDCVAETFTYDITARAHNGIAPMFLEIDFGDGFSDSRDSTVFTVRHTYHGCGPITHPELGWTIRATVTDYNGNQGVDDAVVYPCSQC